MDGCGAAATAVLVRPPIIGSAALAGSTLQSVGCRSASDAVSSLRQPPSGAERIL